MGSFGAWFGNLTYYRRNIAKCKAWYLRARTKTGLSPKKVVLFYPEMPLSWHVIYPICHILGYRMSNDPRKKFDIAMAFHDITERPENNTLSEIAAGDKKVLNIACTDISKARVDEVFEKIFGYGVTVDPRTHHGPYVKKTNTNALHEMEILDKPSEPEQGFVYQKLIDNRTKDDAVTDIRTFIFGDDIPFTLYRTHDIHDRFGDNTITAVRVDTDKAFSEKERADILRFCKAFGLDYGELDVLRDKGDGRIYIVDVNNTPSGPRPGLHMSKEAYALFLKELSHAFEKLVTMVSG